MAISLPCPSCAARVSVPESALGRSVRCPRCDHVFTADEREGISARGDRDVPLPIDDRPLARARPVAPAGSAGRTLALAAALIMSFLALAAAGVALGIVWFRSPFPGSGLKKYDFSTPAAAYRSRLEIEANKDLRAEIELQTELHGPQIKEHLRTLQVKKEAEWRGKKILFVSYEQKGVKKHETVAFEKDAKTGYWLRSYVSAYDVRNENRDLADQMESWSRSGSLEGGRKESEIKKVWEPDRKFDFKENFKDKKW